MNTRNETNERPVYRLSGDEREAVSVGAAQADRGEFVPDDVVAAYFKKFRKSPPPKS